MWPDRYSYSAACHFETKVFARGYQTRNSMKSCTASTVAYVRIAVQKKRCLSAVSVLRNYVI